MKKKFLYFLAAFGCLFLTTSDTVIAAKNSHSDEESKLWRHLYSNPIVAKNLKESHACGSCWGTCLANAGVANCCADEVCIGTCDDGYCVSSPMSTALSIIIIGCSGYCLFHEISKRH
ncbi:hypothetical protein Bealeia1_01560 [Candidatus Bealeia paramacronuclearis]|uniref:Uncharacterized protein n=1 Tax=Candidatus Bealeia paramacronuclearis TaxID=1921001 RepID=A0ABZ2C4I7_9PROT|nr:hypothetical protein [Candidatus Bealeia paramacronuclearis]